VNAAAADATPAWTRAAIRARLAGPRHSLPRGDATTALRLSDADNLTPYDAAKFGPVTFSAIPGAQAGAPGVTTPRVPAAVLVPLVEHADGFKILLTQRMADLKSHAGQISFPGGRIEPGDRDAEHGALREAEEEIGLPPVQVEILGRLDPYTTVSGFDVIPVVGAVTPPLSLKRDPIEVADIFEVPLSFFLDPANHQRHSRAANGVTRAYYAMPYGDRYIWGATAGMLLNLYEVLTAPT
jgi:8-oxo-dGTP pyrophosphatase MutT (NUDIX family)